MYTFFLKRAPARHKGSPTKPHFENTISILYLKIKYIHQKIQLKFFRGSKKFLTSKYLLIFPDGICSNLNNIDGIVYLCVFNKKCREWTII